MTNDDRSNDDRTGDGQAPRWGEAPQQPAGGSEPRYGERVDPAADSTPQYGPPQYGSTEHGQQQYGSGSWSDQQQSHQPYAASSAPASAGAPAWQSYDERPAETKKKRTVGVVALILGLVALILGVVAGYCFGSAIADSKFIQDAIQNGGSAGSVNESDAAALSSSPTIIIGGVLALVGTVLGIWAIVQGIIAIATKRGRGFGVFGLTLAVLGPVALFILYVAIAGAAVMGAAGTAP